MFYELLKSTTPSSQFLENNDEICTPSQTEMDDDCSEMKNEMVDFLRNEVNFEEKVSLIGKTYGTKIFESFAKEGSPRYQDLWLKNPRDPFAVTSVHSLSHNIPDKMENMRASISSCMNLTKKTSGLYNNVFSESQDKFSRFESFSNHASASSSDNKLSDISTPRHSTEVLGGDTCGLRRFKKYNTNKSHQISERVPGNKLFFKSVKRTSQGENSSLEKIKKCLEDLDI
ncbi:hypothetical protein HHI36_010310 [Cryptolaemus montrouzieri]|uniref:Uncharacterized protein n=1 Tax=Cryptolaemus montrouzieri TaxID=559131 RepID=A0ABD2MID8_9CUCU